MGRGEAYTIRYFEFQSGQTRELFRKAGPFWHLWLAVSPDEECMLFGEGPWPGSELMLMENFR